MEHRWRVEMFSRHHEVLHLIETTTLHKALDLIKEITFYEGKVCGIRMDYVEVKS